MRTPFRLETSPFSRLDFAYCKHILATRSSHATLHVYLRLANDAVASPILLILTVNHPGKRSLRASLLPKSTSLQRTQ